MIKDDNNYSGLQLHGDSSPYVQYPYLTLHVQKLIKFCSIKKRYCSGKCFELLSEFSVHAVCHVSSALLCRLLPLSMIFPLLKSIWWLFVRVRHEMVMRLEELHEWFTCCYSKHTCYISQSLCWQLMMKWSKFSIAFDINILFRVHWYWSTFCTTSLFRAATVLKI